MTVKALPKTPSQGRAAFLWAEPAVFCGDIPAQLNRDLHFVKKNLKYFVLHYLFVYFLIYLIIIIYLFIFVDNFLRNYALIERTGVYIL